LEGEEAVLHVMGWVWRPRLHGRFVSGSAVLRSRVIGRGEPVTRLLSLTDCDSTVKENPGGRSTPLASKSSSQEGPAEHKEGGTFACTRLRPDLVR
jgi:hypothetical protein